MGSNFPAHRLCCVHRDNEELILAATGPCIQSISRTSGEVLCTWPRDETEYESDKDEHNGRPIKRRKVEASNSAKLGREGSDASEADINIIAEGKQRQKGERRRPKLPDITLPNISHIIATSNGRHAIAITAEDKAVRVYNISRAGHLRQISHRVMPKKSCAITLTKDETTILTADKFGDVYSLPLHPSPDYESRTEVTPQPEKEKTFKPSASELTVHTKGNLDALRQQQLQKERKPRKEGPGFQHSLLLGHVSLLTDLIIAEGNINGKLRPFILTADRDEHIRVSRGIPQTHIIHSFCLGSTEFLTKLCILPWAPHILVSGDGQPSLRLWDWQTGKQIACYNILNSLGADIQSYLSAERTQDKLAVSGIWPISTPSQDSTSSITNALLVALEGLPILLVFSIHQSSIRYCQTMKLNGNILDVTHLQQSYSIAVSIDHVHKSGSYKNLRDEKDITFPQLHIFALSAVLVASSGDEQISSILPVLESSIRLEDVPITIEVDKPDSTSAEGKTNGWERLFSPLGELLYGLENLRKRRGRSSEEDVDEDEFEGVPELKEI